MSQVIVILKVDPEKRRIVRMPIKATTRGVRGVLGIGNLKHHVVMDEINGEKLIVGVRVGLPEDSGLAEWRIRGFDNYAGVGILFGSRDGGDMSYMGNCPVDVAWAEKMIVWCEPGDSAPAAEVAARMGLPAPETVEFSQIPQDGADDAGK